jgi:hypothetical protein
MNSDIDRTTRWGGAGKLGGLPCTTGTHNHPPGTRKNINPRPNGLSDLAALLTRLREQEDRMHLVFLRTSGGSYIIAGIPEDDYLATSLAHKRTTQ